MCCICSCSRLFHGCFIFTSCTLPKCFCCSFSPTRLHLLLLLSQVRRLSTCFSACTQTWPVTTPARRPLRRSSSSMGTTTTEASTGKKSHSLTHTHTATFCNSRLQTHCTNCTTCSAVSLLNEDLKFSCIVCIDKSWSGLVCAVCFFIFFTS